MKNPIKNILILFVSVCLLSSCEQERLDPILTAADGGGTLSKYIAYTIDSTDPMGSNVYGRIVFYKTTLDQTLVQVSLFNTIPGLLHPAILLEDPVGTENTTMVTLDMVSGDSGELNDNKFFVITDTSFYDSILTLDSHINIYLSESDDTIVASGNLGTNAAPVESN